MSEQELSDFNKKLKIAMGIKNKPNISVNKLGEFLTASAKRQRRILQQLKYPKASRYGATAYQETREAIKRYFLNDFNFKTIEDVIDDLENKIASSDWNQDMIDSSIEALELIADSDHSSLSDFIFEPYNGSNPRMNIEGVEVSVYPDLVIRSKGKGNNFVGALKIHITKNFKLDIEGSKYIAAIIYAFVEKDIMGKSETVKQKLCVSYDVFSDTFVECPVSVKRRWEDIEAGCKNIVAIWDTIEKPIKKS
jgi:hypothetical protein